MHNLVGADLSAIVLGRALQSEDCVQLTAIADKSAPTQSPVSKRVVHGSGGFTLIELLVVLVIIGCMVSFAALSIGNTSGSRELRGEAERLAALIGVLADEAVLDGREYGLLLSAEGYRVLTYDTAMGSWNAAATPPEHRVPSWTRLLLELDGEPLKLPEPQLQHDNPGLAKEGDEQKKPPLLPQVLILSSGELSPFRLRLEARSAGGGAYNLASDGYQLPNAELAQD